MQWIPALAWIGTQPIFDLIGTSLNKNSEPFSLGIGLREAQEANYEISQIRNDGGKLSTDYQKPHGQNLYINYRCNKVNERDHYTENYNVDDRIPSYGEGTGFGKFTSKKIIIPDCIYVKNRRSE